MTLRPPLSWENFRASIVVPGEQRVHRFAEGPTVEVFGDGMHGRIGLWLEVPTGSKVPDDILMLAFVSAQVIQRRNLTLLELAVTSPNLFRQFYYFAVAVSERVLTDHKPAIEAVMLELQSFAELLETKALLGIERQLGLLGELLVLERLVRNGGPATLEAWIGPKREPHDFRIGVTEFEVKTTTRSQRIHTIHGTEQLMASQDCSLFVLSVMLAPTGMGEGFSLVDKIDALEILLSPVPALKQAFKHGLRESGYREADRPHYLRRYSLRRPPALVPVDGRLPAITRASIQVAFGAGAARLDSIEYDVNLEGLEVADQDAGFSAIFSA